MKGSLPATHGKLFILLQQRVQIELFVYTFQTIDWIQWHPVFHDYSPDLKSRNTLTVGSVDNCFSKTHQMQKNTLTTVRAQYKCDITRACLGCLGAVRGWRITHTLSFIFFFIRSSVWVPQLYILLFQPINQLLREESLSKRIKGLRNKEQQLFYCGFKISGLDLCYLVCDVIQTF